MVSAMVVVMMRNERGTGDWFSHRDDHAPGKNDRGEGEQHEGFHEGSVVGAFIEPAARAARRSILLRDATAFR